MRIIEPSEVNTVMAGEIPKKVGIIMDGNRRWCHARDLGPEKFHEDVADSVISTLGAALALGVPELALFALSVENLSRPKDEVESLIRGSRWLWTPKLVHFLSTKQVTVSSRGESLDGYPELQVPESLRNMKNGNEQCLHVEFFLNYSGGREAMRRSQEGIGGASLGGNPIDLCIRTAGEIRTSGFAPLDIMAAELVFTDTLWPDFRGLHMYSAVYEYQTRRRRFGR